MRAGIALGSNLGDRASFLKKGVEKLRMLHEKGDFMVSSFLESEPVDCPAGSPSFLNAVAELETSLDPIRLLHHLKSIEVFAGRPQVHDYHSPRTLYLDLLYCGSLTLNLPELQLPHPRIKERDFVLIPLVEIRPDLILPGCGESSCKDLLKNRKNNK